MIRSNFLVLVNGHSGWKYSLMLPATSKATFQRLCILSLVPRPRPPEASVYCVRSVWVGKSSQEVEEAEQMLPRFYLLAPKLYPLQVCSAVTHSLIHVPQSVRLCGPLWGFSMFGYENMNGLLKFCRGTRNVLDQLVFSYQVQKVLPSTSGIGTPNSSEICTREAK